MRYTYTPLENHEASKLILKTSSRVAAFFYKQIKVFRSFGVFLGHMPLQLSQALKALRQWVLGRERREVRVGLILREGKIESLG